MVWNSDKFKGILIWSRNPNYVSEFWVLEFRCSVFEFWIQFKNRKSVPPRWNSIDRVLRTTLPWVPSPSSDHARSTVSGTVALAMPRLTSLSSLAGLALPRLTSLYPRLVSEIPLISCGKLRIPIGKSRFPIEELRIPIGHAYNFHLETQKCHWGIQKSCRKRRIPMGRLTLNCPSVGDGLLRPPVHSKLPQSHWKLRNPSGFLG